MNRQDPDITIVIVEGKEVKRLALRRSLGAVPGFRVAGEAADGLTAISKAINLRPQVVMIDAGVPQMNGLELARQVKDQLPDAKVMMMATEGSGIDILAAIGAGADSFCEKSLPNSKLEMAVRTVASGGAWLDRTVALQVLRAAAAGAHTAEEDPKCKLTSRERQVLSLIVDGCSNNAIAKQLCISVQTVKTHIRHLIDKLGVHSRTEAAVKAVQENLVAPANGEKSHKTH